MSLINEALKKAQRLRTEEPAGDSAPIPGGGTRIAKRGQARSANTMVLIVSGAIVLVVLSVIATVYLLNRPSPTQIAATKTASGSATPPSTSSPSASTPVIVPPAITPPASTPVEPATGTPTPPAPVSTPKGKAGPATDVGPKPVEVTQTAPIPVGTGGTAGPGTGSPPTSLSGTATVNTAPAPAVPTPAPVPAVTKPDERVTAFVEAVRVTGIRSSGPDGRVLMNDRVYRVNDVVDRKLNIKLVKVAVDSLTFADANGVTYVKYF